MCGFVRLERNLEVWLGVSGSEHLIWCGFAAVCFAGGFRSVASGSERLFWCGFAAACFAGGFRSEPLGTERLHFRYLYLWFCVAGLLRCGLARVCAVGEGS